MLLLQGCKKRTKKVGCWAASRHAAARANAACSRFRLPLRGLPGAALPGHATELATPRTLRRDSAGS